MIEKRYLRSLALLFMCGLVLLACQRASKVDPELVASTVLTGTISLSDGSEPSGVNVEATWTDNDAIKESYTTGVDGSYRISGLPPGVYEVNATKTQYETAKATVELLRGQSVNQDLELVWIPVYTPTDILYISGGSNDGDPEQTGVVGDLLGSAFVVEVRDGLGDPLSGVQVVFDVIVSSGGGSMGTSALVISGADGRAYNTYKLGSDEGRNHVRVVAAGLDDDHVDFFAQGVRDTPSAILIEEGEGQSGVVGQALADAVVVKVVDRFNNPISNASVHFAPSHSGQADPADVITDEAGLAQTIWNLGPTTDAPAREHSLGVSSGDLEVMVLALADHDAAVELVKVSGDNQTGMLSVELELPLVAGVVDQFGNGVDAIDVWFGTSGLVDIVPPASVIQDTDDDGKVSVMATPHKTYTHVTANVDGLGSVQFDYSIVIGDPDHIVANSGSGQWGYIGDTLSQDFQFKLEDSGSSGIEGGILIFEAGGLRGTPGTVDPPTATTSASGHAEVSLTLGTAAGQNAQWVTARLQGLPGVTEGIQYANVFADPVAAISIVSGDGQSGDFAQPLAESLVAFVADAYDNPVPDEQVSWSSSTGGSVTPNPGTTDAAGQAFGVGTLGPDPNQPVQQFTAEAAGYTVNFTASGTGHFIDQIVPAVVPPGYPDPGAANPELIPVQIQLLGGGFTAGALVVWDQWGSAEEIVPDSIQPGEILFTLMADRFIAGTEAVYMVSVRNGNDDLCSPVPFSVGFVFPDSGQTTAQCTDYVYDGSWEWVAIDCADIQSGEAYYGQDGHYHQAYTQPDFTNNGDGTVSDGLTQLMWTRCAAGQNLTTCTGTPSYLSQLDSIAYCLNLILAGHDDWELPSILELQQIGDYGRQNTRIDETVFPHPPTEGYWSITMAVEDPSEAWRWTAQQGRIEEAPANLADGIARCVRSRTPPPQVRFVRSEPIPNEPVVADQMTGLVWQGCTAGLSGLGCDQGSRSSLEWPDALDYCENLVWAGETDWRLPQVKELPTIIDFGRYWPAWDPAFFPNLGYDWAFTSTSFVGLISSSVYSVRFASGLIGAAGKGWPGRSVLCVRSDF